MPRRDRAGRSAGVIATASAERFAAVWRRLGARSDALAAYHEAARRYAEPARAYHTLAHIARCLEISDEARSQAERPDEVELALWLHDVVYDPHRADNEELSAKWAGDALRAGSVADAVVRRVGELILATRHAQSPAPGDAQLVVDVDLAILGAAPVEFDDYERQIRREFAWVEESTFRKARAEVLERFLAREHIYFTRPFRARLEAQARENLTRSRARLRAE